MKKTLSILFASLVLLSGMHLSMATHICGGEVAAVKWSFSGKMATCGMEESSQSNNPVEKTVSSNCCHNEVVVYAVDNNYNPTSFQVKEISQNLLQVFYVPVSFVFHIAYSSIVRTNVSPPGDLLVSAVTLSDICVFRI